jgi:acylphosphatase
MKFLSYLTAIIVCLGLCIITVSNIAWTDDNLQIIEKEKKIVLKGQISKALGEYDSHLKGAVEYLACGPTGKLYESIITIEASTKDVHEALSKLGVKPGTPPAYDDEKDALIPPTGTTFLLTVEWQEDEETKKVRAEELIYNVKTNKPMPPVAWIYSGSRVIPDLDSDDEDAMIPHAYMSNHIVALKQTDGSALFQNPLPESVEENLYKKNDDLLPELGTSVKLIIEVNRKMQLYVLISGKVQRVGFRDFTQTNAKQLGINGYAKNLQNGKVEVVAEGDKLQLNALVKKTTTGSPCFKS